MVGVSNSSPLIFLSKIGHTSLFEVCFERLVLPPAVAKEVGTLLLLHVPGWEIRDLDEAGASFVAKALGRLHRGELEALWLAKMLNADVVLLDDRRARQKAKTLDLQPLGTLGVLAYAHKLGALSLSDAERAVFDLQTGANMYLSDRVLQEVGEQLGRQEEEK